MSDLRGYVVFCEDIRLEIDNQVSFIGVYPKGIHTFDIDVDGDIALAKFAAACYMALPTSSAGSIPKIQISLVKKNDEEKVISIDDLPAIPVRSEIEYVKGVKFIQFEGIIAQPDDHLKVTLIVDEQSACIGRFRIRGKEDSLSVEGDVGDPHKSTI